MGDNLSPKGLLRRAPGTFLSKGTHCSTERNGTGFVFTSMSKDIEHRPYRGPAGGWGSLQSLFRMLLQERVLFRGMATLWKQNKPDGHMCVSCAWAKPAESRPFEFCENGAKATAWEITAKRTRRNFSPGIRLANCSTMVGSPAREKRPADASVALRCHHGSLRAGVVGRGVQPYRGRVAPARSEIRGDVHLRTRLAGSVLHVSVVWPHVRHQQFP